VGGSQEIASQTPIAVFSAPAMMVRIRILHEGR
jgi:hypothetical protein